MVFIRHAQGGAANDLPTRPSVTELFEEQPGGSLSARAAAPFTSSPGNMPVPRHLPWHPIVELDAGPGPPVLTLRRLTSWKSQVGRSKTAATAFGMAQACAGIWCESLVGCGLLGVWPTPNPDHVLPPRQHAAAKSSRMCALPDLHGSKGGRFCFYFAPNHVLAEFGPNSPANKPCSVIGQPGRTARHVWTLAHLRLSWATYRGLFERTGRDRPCPCLCSRAGPAEGVTNPGCTGWPRRRGGTRLMDGQTCPGLNGLSGNGDSKTATGSGPTRDQESKTAQSRTTTAILRLRKEASPGPRPRPETLPEGLWETPESPGGS